MDDRDADRIISRLLQIERRLEEIDRRLLLLESPKPAYFKPEPLEHAHSAQPPPGPPPVIERDLSGWDVPATPQPPAPAPVEPQRIVWSPAAPSPRPSGILAPLEIPKPRGKLGDGGDDLEYKIGRIGLLWAGAVVVVMGFLYLAALAAWTPQMKFGGAISLCLALIVLGFVKRNEREEFGQILTGIGSCGLYITFAGGQIYSKLYPGETTVSLFLALSLANLGYAAWRSSRSFLGLGMIGGLVAAMLPMHDYNAPLDVGLHFVILVPCALIVVRNKFIDMAAWLWIASTLALLPIYTYVDHMWPLRVGALYADALLCAGLYAYVHRDWRLDPKCALPAVIVGLAGIGGVAIEGVRNGSLHVFALAAGATAIGWLVRERTLARNSLYAGALAVSVALAPMGYTRTEAAIAFSALSIALSIGSLRLAGNLLRALAYTEIALAACAYLGVWLQSPTPLPFWSEIFVLTAMMAAIVCGASCATRAGLPPEGAISVGAALTLPLFERFGSLFLTAPSVGATEYVGGFFTTLVAFSLMYSLAKWRPYVASVVGSWILYALAIGIYLACVTSHPYSFNVDVSMVGCLVIIGLLQAHLTVPKLKGAEFDVVVSASGAMIGIYAVRLTFLLLSRFTNFSESSAVCVGASIWTLVAAGLCARLKLKPLVGVSWMGLGLFLWGLWPMSQWEEAGVKYEAPLSLLAVGCILAVGAVTTKWAKGDSRDLSIGVFGLMAGGTWIRFAFLELTKALPREARLADTHAFATGALLCFISATAMYYWRKEKATVPLAWVGAGLFLGAVIPPSWMLGLDHGGRRLEAPMLLLALGVPLALVRATSMVTKERVILTGVPIALNWMSFTRLCLHLTHFGADRANAVVSLAWTAFAMILIAVGFGYRAPYVRYWGLAIFGTVLGKVFLIDLANVEAAIRVAVLLFLGLCMVGAGYGYVRWKQVKPT